MPSDPGLKISVRFFLAFTAVFAVLAACVFWGTWALDIVPVMPDTSWSYPRDDGARAWQRFLSSGKFIPSDLIWLSGIPYFWQELRYVLAIYLSALALAYYCRARGLGHLAAYGSGLLLAFSGYWLTLFSAGHYGWFLWMFYGLFAFGLIDRAVRGNRLRHWLVLGAVVAWASFNQQDLWFLFTIFTVAYFIWSLIRERCLPWKGMLAAAAVFTIIGLPNFRDTFANTIKEREAQIARGENVTDKGASARDRRWEFVTNWSMPIEDTAEFIVPRIHGDTSCPLVLSINRAKGVRPYDGALGRPLNQPRGNYRQHSLYIGWVTCLLSAAGIFFALRRRQGEVLFFAVAALIFYAFSLGRNFAPAYRLIFALPFGDIIRCPVKWHHLTEFALSVLAAYGIEGILRAWGKFRWRRIPVVFVALAALILWGAGNLAWEAHRYCAPIDVGRARATNRHSELTILSRPDFQNSQVSAAVRSGQIVSVANYLGSPNHFLVQVLKPFGPQSLTPYPPLWRALGFLSFFATLAVLVAALVKRKTNKGKEP